MREKTRVVLVDAQPVVLLGMRYALQSSKRLRGVGEARDGARGLDLISRLTPDVAVVAVALPELDGVQVAGAARTFKPQNSNHPDQRSVQRRTKATGEATRCGSTHGSVPCFLRWACG